MRPKAIDLFAGAGGMSLGFEQAGFDIVAAVELDPVHAGVHRYNFPQTNVICKDVSKLTGEGLLDGSKLNRGEVDVVFGGPPCQGFSLIGKRLIDDPRNGLLGEFCRIVNELQPKYFVMENVSGLAIGKSTKVLHQFISTMKQFGYNVLPYKVLNAAHYGVPQDRRRLIVIGHRQDVPRPDYPEAQFELRGKTGVNGLQESFYPWCPSVHNAIGDLPNIDDYEELLYTDEFSFRCEPDHSYAQHLREKKEDEYDLSYPRNWNKNTMTNCLRTKHTPQSVKRFSDTSPGETEPISRFYRLHNEGVSNTLRAGTDSKRGAHTSPRPIHPIHPRCISVREAARIHSYPDWFRLHVTKWHGFRQIGNSVPPLLARAIGAEIVKALNISPIKPENVIRLGDAALLKMDMSTAADYFGVPRDVIGTRDRRGVNQTKDKSLQHV